ncbi:MAG: hypothetical protein LM587_01830 [Candidatus Aenigmarchaeota archaeon]|nr:hypothetical protein [Candidatus Aenigmarchaeota archaeon]
MEKPKKRTETKPYKIGVCVECKVRDGDSSKKKLYQCPYCGRWFCEKHIEPRIATTRGAIEQIRDPVLRDKVLEEWRKPDGHPDTVWTKKYFEDLKKQEEEQRQKFWETIEDLERIKEEKEFEKTKKLIETPTITFTPKPNKKRIETESSVKARKINAIPILLIVGIISFIVLVSFMSQSGFNLFKNNVSYTNDSQKARIIQTPNIQILTIISEPVYIQNCKTNAEEEIKALRIRYPVDFTHRLVLMKEFTSIGEAEEFARKYTTFPIQSICRSQNPKKVIVLIYELDYSNPVQIGGFGAVITLTKESTALFCGENGKVLKVGIAC